MSDDKNSEDEAKFQFLKKKRWTELEKRILLKELKKHGSTNVHKIKPMLPNKSFHAIEQMISKYQAIAEFGKKEVNSPLDVWLRSGLFNEEPLISQALHFINLFEDHPPPEETAGFDLKLAYQFLYEASKGKAMTHLTPKTAEMLKELIVAVDTEIWPANECNTTDYLIGKLSSVESEKSYKRRKID